MREACVMRLVYIKGFLSFNWIFMWFKNTLINEGQLHLEIKF